MSDPVCKVCGEELKLQGTSELCSSCCRDRRREALRARNSELRRKRMFREGVLMWRTWKLLDGFGKRGVTKVSFMAILRSLGLKADCKKISGRQIQDRKIVKNKALKCGWEAKMEGSRLFFTKPAIPVEETREF